jgi:predicted NUDIX family NTP pyrophosphohydrolase
MGSVAGEERERRGDASEKREQSARPTKFSAGLLMYRRCRGALEVLLAHPGGPFFAHKDDGAWTLPKGIVGKSEDPLEAAKREFTEETSLPIATERFVPLGEVVQRGGKHVVAWAFEGDCDPAKLASNTYKLEWPRNSGRWKSYPEVDRAQWFGLAEGRTKLNPAQAEFLERLEREIAGGRTGPSQS